MADFGQAEPLTQPVVVELSADNARVRVLVIDARARQITITFDKGTIGPEGFQAVFGDSHQFVNKDAVLNDEGQEIEPERTEWTDIARGTELYHYCLGLGQPTSNSVLLQKFCSYFLQQYGVI